MKCKVVVGVRMCLECFSCLVLLSKGKGKTLILAGFYREKPQCIHQGIYHVETRLLLESAAVDKEMDGIA